MNLINLIDLYSSDSIFANIDIYTEYDKELLVNTIIQKCMLAEPLFTELDFLNYNIRLWFSKNKYTFERLYIAYTSEFNPIYNYDRYDDEKYENDTNFSSSDETSETNTNKVSPFDTSSFVNDSQTTNSSKDSSNQKTENEFMRTNHSYGNIGVTTSTTMLEDFYRVIPSLNVYELIANLFYDEFMIKCY